MDNVDMDVLHNINEIAHEEGWGIFYNVEICLFELQRIDEMTNFATDTDAAKFVWENALKDEKSVHFIAIEWLKTYCIREYNLIKQLICK